ncbi:hypothetical protein PMAYCL1PPCAC_31589, partial [Pristionchus mayeri]
EQEWDFDTEAKKYSEITFEGFLKLPVILPSECAPIPSVPDQEPLSMGEQQWDVVSSVPNMKMDSETKFEGFLK